ncbi:MAG: type II toxin-antitoxin system VapC family toxin [Bryobacteraceae bacterium]
MTVLVDSDILIEVTRARDAEILRKWAELAESQDDVLCSPVSIAELWHGALPRECDVLTNLFRALTCIPIDAEIGRKAGEFLRRYRKSHSVELGDALIAASAVVTGAALWTRNRKHYPMSALALF